MEKTHRQPMLLEGTMDLIIIILSINGSDSSNGKCRMPEFFYFSLNTDFRPTVVVNRR